MSRRRPAAVRLGAALLGAVLAAGCARVVVPPTPVAPVDLLRIELFYAGRIDPNLYYIVAVNRNGNTALDTGPDSIVAGVDIARNWTDALIWHDNLWTYHTGGDVRVNGSGEPLSSARLTRELAWNTTVTPYLPNFGLVENVFPRGGGKITLELCKTFFALAENQRSQTSRCDATTGVAIPDTRLSFNFMVSPLLPDRNGSFNVLDALVETFEFTISKNALQTSLTVGSPPPNTPDINLTGHNTAYERGDVSPADGVPDDINTTYGGGLADTDGDTIPDVVETALDTDPGNGNLQPTFAGLPVVLDELLHPADLTFWRLREVEPGQL